MATAAALMVPKAADSLPNLVSRSSYAHFKHYLQLSRVSAHDRRVKFETQVFQTGFIALFTRQKNFEGLVRLLKMVFKCRNAWCAPSMDRVTVHSKISTQEAKIINYFASLRVQIDQISPPHFCKTCFNTSG